MTQPPKQPPPWTFRPYPPVRAGWERLGQKNLSWWLNVAIGRLLGLSEQDLEQYRKRDIGDVDGEADAKEGGEA